MRALGNRVWADSLTLASNWIGISVGRKVEKPPSATRKESAGLAIGYHLSAVSFPSRRARRLEAARKPG